LPPLKLAKTLPTIGERLFVISNDPVFGRSFAAIRVAGRCGGESVCSASANKGQFFFADVPFHHGQSGSPVINEKGMVVGVVSQLLSTDSKILLLSDPPIPLPAVAIVPRYGVFSPTNHIFEKLPELLQKQLEDDLPIQ
jgi:S1-C subfamily serine protease